jgi:hypothetical protein
MERILEMIGVPHPRAMAAVRSQPGPDRAVASGL